MKVVIYARKKGVMGLRSWFTKVRSANEFAEFRRALHDNDLSYGVHYAAVFKGSLPALSDSLQVAWSGDGSSSLEQMPVAIQERSVLLDDLPFHPNEDSFARIFGSMEEVQAHLEHLGKASAGWDS